MPIEGITSTQQIGVYVDEQGLAQIFETPGGRGQPAEAEVTYITRWAARKAVYRELLGGFAQMNGLGVPLPGHAYPESPNLSCEAIGRVQPVGVNKALIRANPGSSPEALAARRWNHPKWCLVPASYRPLDYAYSIESANDANQLDPGEPIIGCRQRTEGNNTFIVVDNASMEIMDGRFNLNEPPGPQIPRNKQQSTDGIPANSVAFTLEYPRVPRNPWRFLRPFLGKLNLFRMWDLPPGHILFAGVSIDTNFGYYGPEISATLTYIGNLDVGWNETIDDDGVVKAKTFVKSTGGAPEFFKYPFALTDLMIPLR